MHDALAKVDNNDIVYAKAAAEYVLSVFGAVDKRHGFFENKVIGVHIKCKHGRLCARLFRALLYLVDKRCVSDMYAVKKSERHYFLFCHWLTSKKLFIVFSFPFSALPTSRNSPDSEYTL